MKLQENGESYTTHAFYSSPDIIRNNKSRRLRWAGHVARIGESRNAYRVLVGRPEGKRPLGRPRRRWKDNIKMDLMEVGYDDRDWINLAQDRDQWRAYMASRSKGIPPRTRATECVLDRILMGKEISHEISACVWDRCPPSIVMHLGSYDRPLEKPKEEICEVFCMKYILYGAETWTLRRSEEKRLEKFEMGIWRRMEKRNGAVLERMGEERMMQKLIRNRKRNWLGHWLRRNCTEGCTEGNGEREKSGAEEDIN
ncbi:hypothetical protein ANN_08532 [Periplaneta americana]|uniref:Uncharacterized protein n=1 Tax=Periplaneta americana TaxID=6978 RepID=A0ABQ8T2U8_PERAM|nr:hypothetical protein ANN_08532 [Periplaneta americana]